jgi:sporulation protein YlmC with PRC-barrel domain
MALAANNDVATQATGMGDIFVSPSPVNGDEHLASNLMGTEIYGLDQSTAIGKISDLVIGRDGNVEAVVVVDPTNAGKTVAISFDKLQWPLNKQNALMVNGLTNAQFAEAPAFDTSTFGGVAPTTDGKVNQAMNTTTSSAMQKSTGQVTPDEQNMAAVDAATLSANELINATVYSANNENVGEVGDVILTQDGKIDSVVLDVGGFLGLGEKPVAIAFDAIDFRRDGNGTLFAYTRFTRDQLDNAPEYKADLYMNERDSMRLVNP